MRAYPDDQPDMALLERVGRRLPEDEARRVAALPHDDYLTWIEVYFTLRRAGVVLDAQLNEEFMAQLFTEAGIDVEIAAEKAARIDSRRAARVLAPPTGLADVVAAAAH